MNYLKCVVFTHHSVDLVLLLTLLCKKILHFSQEELNLPARVLGMYVSVLLSLSKSQKCTPDQFYQVRSEVQIGCSGEDSWLYIYTPPYPGKISCLV